MSVDEVKVWFDSHRPHCMSNELTEKQQEAVELRNEFEEIMGVMATVNHKLNQFIEGEITHEEYTQWVDDKNEMFESIPL